MSKSNEMLNETLPIIVNGHEKLASGLTKRTTINDIKYALLHVSETKSFDLEDYAIFEKWQGNERILDGNLKIYKLIRLWKSLPGEQLKHVKFIIKKRKAALSDITNQHKLQQQQQLEKLHQSPSMNKTWAKRKTLRKRSATKYQQRHIESSDESSSSDEKCVIKSRSRSRAAIAVNSGTSSKRYSSIRRFNRSKSSTIRKTFIELVTKQNEIIDKQLNTLAQKDYDLEKVSQQKTDKKRRSKSCELKVKDDVCEQQNDVTKNDIMNVFDNVLDDKQASEYVKLCNDYFKLEKSVNTNQNKIQQLNTNFQQYKQSCEVYDKQNLKLNNLNCAIDNIDKIIYLKTNLIQTLENELKVLDNQCEQSSNSSSPKSSTSSLLSSVSNSYNNNNNNYVQSKTHFNDNESDTGISSANSEDCQNQLETLV